MYRFARELDASDFTSGFVPNESSEAGPSRMVRVRSDDDRRHVSFERGNSEYNIVILPTARAGTVSHALAQLRRYSHFQGSNKASFESAEQFLGLAIKLARSTEISVQFFDGNAALNFRNRAIEAQFEFLSNGIIACNIDFGGDEWDEDVAGFNGKALPPEIAARFNAAAHA